MTGATPAFLSAAPLQPLFVCSQFLPLLAPNFCELPGTCRLRCGAPAGYTMCLCKTKLVNKSTNADHERIANITFLHMRNKSSVFPPLFHPEAALLHQDPCKLQLANHCWVLSHLTSGSCSADKSIQISHQHLFPRCRGGVYPIHPSPRTRT